MKADSRVDGHWKNDDPAPAYIPRQIRMIQDLGNRKSWILLTRLILEQLSLIIINKEILVNPRYPLTAVYMA